MDESKKVTIKDIAETANVSKSTVSRVLNNSTPVNKAKRQAVLAAVAELDFEPNIYARGLAGGQSMTIGVQTPELGSYCYDLATKGIIQALTGTKYSPIFVMGGFAKESQRATIETLIRRQVDGLLIVFGDLNRSEIDEISQKKPVLFVGRKIAGLESDCVFINNFDAGYRATKFLIEQGHRQILHIHGIKDCTDAIERFEGYKSALRDSEIKFDEGLIYPGKYDGASGEAAIESALEAKKKFTAVFAANDRMAFGARLAFFRHGIKVPEDVSIIGFDDQLECAYSTPPLTSIRQPSFEMGQLAATAMLNLLGKKNYEMPCLPAEIIVRESTRSIV